MLVILTYLLSSVELTLVHYNKLQSDNRAISLAYLGPIVAEIKHGIFVRQRIAWRLRLTTSHSMAKHVIDCVRIRRCNVSHATLADLT